MYNLSKQNPSVFALVSALVTVIVASLMYFMLEPGQIFAVDTDANTFTVTQTIGSEISFSTTQGNLTMSNSIGGATGGVASSTAVVAVTSNDSTGYTIAIKFSSTTAMNHSADLDSIDNYGTTSPDYNMNLGASLSGFAYSVSSTNQVAAFDNTGSACGSGSGKSVDSCYAMHGTPTSDFTIVDSSGVATAEETQIGFKVIVAPSSGLVNGSYIATTTLTASTKV